MFKFLILIFCFFNNFIFSYDEIDDIMNQYKYRENITKLLLVKKDTNIRNCNDLKCDIIREIKKNSILVSSNFDKWYQIKINEWVHPDNVEEIKIFNEKDFLIKKDLDYKNTYVLYKGTIIKNDDFITLKKDVFLELNSNFRIINNKKINKFTLIKSDENKIKSFSFENLLKIDLSLFNKFNDLDENDDYIISENLNEKWYKKLF